MIVRCYNCGLQGHKTQHCPSYGPRYPAPGKTKEDYAAEASRIMALFAADILAEHEPDEDADIRDPVRIKMSSREEAARKFACDTCGAEVGKACHTKGGKRCGCHKDRYSKAAAQMVEEVLK